jgi:hypothetical protein
MFWWSTEFSEFFLVFDVVIFVVLTFSRKSKGGLLFSCIIAFLWLASEVFWGRTWGGSPPLPPPLCLSQGNCLFARSHGLVVKAEDSQLSGCGFESRHRLLDGCYNWKIMKIKVAKWGTPKKYFKKGNCLSKMFRITSWSFKGMVQHKIGYFTKLMFVS